MEEEENGISEEEQELYRIACEIDLNFCQYYRDKVNCMGYVLLQIENKIRLLEALIQREDYAGNAIYVKPDAAKRINDIISLLETVHSDLALNVFLIRRGLVQQKKSGLGLGAIYAAMEQQAQGTKEDGMFR